MADGKGRLAATPPARIRCGRSTTLPLLVAECRKQAINEGGLPGLNLFSRLVGRKPRGAVDLGKGLLPPAPRRPFHLEMIGLELGRIELARDRESRDYLPARQHELA